MKSRLGICDMISQKGDQTCMKKRGVSDSIQTDEMISEVNQRNFNQSPIIQWWLVSWLKNLLI